MSAMRWQLEGPSDTAYRPRLRRIFTVYLQIRDISVVLLCWSRPLHLHLQLTSAEANSYNSHAGPEHGTVMSRTKVPGWNKKVGRIPARASVAHEDQAYPGPVFCHSLDHFSKTRRFMRSVALRSRGIDDRPSLSLTSHIDFAQR